MPIKTSIDPFKKALVSLEALNVHYLRIRHSGEAGQDLPLALAELCRLPVSLFEVKYDVSAFSTLANTQGRVELTVESLVVATLLKDLAECRVEEATWILPSIHANDLELIEELNVVEIATALVKKGFSVTPVRFLDRLMRHRNRYDAIIEVLSHRVISQSDPDLFEPRAPRIERHILLRRLIELGAKIPVLVLQTGYSRPAIKNYHEEMQVRDPLLPDLKQGRHRLACSIFKTSTGPEHLTLALLIYLGISQHAARVVDAWGLVAVVQAYFQIVEWLGIDANERKVLTINDLNAMAVAYRSEELLITPACGFSGQRKLGVTYELVYNGD